MPSVAILGLGKSGVAAAKFYKNKNYKVYLHDDNPKGLEAFQGSDYIIAKPEDWNFKELESVIFSPGIPHLLPKPHIAAELARKNNVEIICDIEVLQRFKHQSSKIIAITGTNGKSTTTALTYHILNECGVDAEIGGNYGIAALELNVEAPNKVFVIEVSSFQLDLCNKAKFDISILLNITPDHLERYNTMENYALSKRRVFEGQKKGDTAIICVEQESTKEIANWCKGNLESEVVEYTTNDSILKNENFPYLPGAHNRQNIMAAYFAAKKIGLSDEKIIAAIKTFKGLKHRAQNVFENDKIKFINDSKATNADATEPALKTFDNIFWMAGGVPKSGGIESLEKYYPKIAGAFFYGEARNDFANTYKNSGYKNFKILEKFKQAFDEAVAAGIEFNKQTGKQAVILLSPACASFDEFKNFEHRGEVFEAMAKETTQTI